MAGIYQRDNINYASMIDSAIKNRNEKAKERAQLYANQGQIWSDAVRNLGQMGVRTMEYIQANKEQAELENKLKELEARRDTIRAAYSEADGYKPYTSTPSYKAGEDMLGYKNFDNAKGSGYNSGYKNFDNAKDRWLQDHPGMTEEDYDKFVEYMNSLYGGE